MNLNTKVSGCQLVLVPIKNMGRNKFPFVENINHRIVKYIDFCPSSYLPNTADPGVTFSDNMYLNLIAENGVTYIHRNLPLERIDYTENLGVREAIGEVLSMDDCYIDCQNASAIGQTAALLVWYDLPEFSARNSSDKLMTDYISIPITTDIRYNQLPDEQRMTGKRFRRIIFNSPIISPDYQTCVGTHADTDLYLSLCKGSYIVCENIPLGLLDSLGKYEKNTFANIVFDFQSSYITVGGAGTNTNYAPYFKDKSVFLNLQYEK